jgi:aldehyde dehydrogenase (NAD+)
MKNSKMFYINGSWINPDSTNLLDVINPSNEKVICQISLANEKDLNLAVMSAKEAFKAFSKFSKQEKIELLENIINVYKKRMPELASAITTEMGAPITLSTKAQVPSGLGHFIQAKKTLENYNFEKEINSSLVIKEPVGVCGLITPWNWPLNQISCKVAPALAAGCTMVLKPSEIAPLSAIVFSDILNEAGLPDGVFNMINGNGADTGTDMSKHQDIDMMSFTGSTNAGIAVAKNSADTVKRVTQELGGKSANIILADADLNKAVSKGVFHCMNNTGQSCNAPTRMLVPLNKMEEVIEIAKATVNKLIVGDPLNETTSVGPLVSETQFNSVKGYIKRGIEEGASLITGGIEMPENINEGYFLRPTIFANVTSDMIVAKEEIFGPVLSILGYENEEEAINIANDSNYGLAGYISTENLDKAKEISSKIRTGMMHINYAPVDQSLPFGGYKMSGNGREWGEYGIEDFLELKSVIGINK